MVDMEEPRRAGSPPLLFESPLFKEFYNDHSTLVPDEISMRVLDGLEEVYRQDDSAQIRIGKSRDTTANKVRFCMSGEVIQTKQAAPLPTQFSLFAWQTREKEAEEQRRVLLQRIADLESDERLEREDIISFSLAQLNGVYSWFISASRNQFKQEEANLLQLNILEEQVSARIKLYEAELEEREEQLKEAARRAWKEEMLQRKELEEELARRAEWKKAQEKRLSAALTFIVVQEKDARRELEAEEPVDFVRLVEKEKEDRVAAEKAAYEAWLATPEGIAFEEENKKKEKKREKLRKQREAEQKRIIAACRHGPGGSSVFAGDNPADKCFSCGFIWDEESSLYIPVNVAGKRKSSALLLSIAEKKGRNSFSLVPRPPAADANKKKPKRAATASKAKPPASKKRNTNSANTTVLPSINMSSPIPV